MKNWTALILALVMCLSLCACGNSGKTQPADDARETEPAEPSLAPSSEQSANATMFEDDAVRALAEQYFDLDSYEAETGSLYKKEAGVDKRIDSAEVDGVTLTIAMPYQDVIALGFQPTDEDFANDDTYGVAKVCDFVTSDNHVVRLAFKGEEAGKTLADGVLYKISTVNDSAERAVIEVEKLKLGSSIELVVSALGEPQRISETGNDVHELHLEYALAERSVYLTVTIDPSTRSVTYLALEGHAE